MTEQTDAAEVGPYIGRSMAEIIDDYVMVRGDLTEQYARDQLLAIIADREAAARAEAWDEGKWAAYNAERDGGDGSEAPNPYRAAQVAPSRVPEEGS